MAFRTADILDGLSNTLFVGERASNMSNVTWTGAVTGNDCDLVHVDLLWE